MTSADNRPLRVFLCHSSNDKPAVRELYQKLRAEPWINPWLDKEDIFPGNDWNLEIQKAIRETDVIIVCLSKSSITKEGYVQREIKTALDYSDEKPERTVYIIPVRLEECKPPERLSKWHYADYFEGQRDLAYKKILVSLKRRVDSLGLKSEEAIQNKAEVSVYKAIAENVEPQLVENIAHKNTLHEGRTRKQRGLLGAGIIILLILILSVIGLNYLINNLPVSTATIVSPTDTAKYESPTSTSISFTSTSWPTKTVSPTPTLGVGSIWVSLADGMEMVYIPEGEFTMGSNSGEKDERPEHKVYLDAYWIDRTEVTNAMYAKCVANGMCEKPFKASSSSHPTYFGNPEFDNYPVIYIDWDMAKTYCDWAGRELPTAAQWEKAARGPNGNIYPWGNIFDGTLGNFCDVNCPRDWANKTFNDGYEDVSPVGNYPLGQSIYGALDMAGNVGEWVNDWYDEAYYENSPSSNPLGPTSGQYRGLRGSSLNWKDDYARASDNGFDKPSVPGKNFGIRCARPLP